MRRSSAAAWALVAVFAASANLLSGFSCGGGKPSSSDPCCDSTATPTPTPAWIDEVEPNDVPADATALGAPGSEFVGSCSSSDPIDYYSALGPFFQVYVFWDVPNWDLDVLVTGSGYAFSDTEGGSPALVDVQNATGTSFIRILCSGTGAGTNYSGIVEP